MKALLTSLALGFLGCATTPRVPVPLAQGAPVEVVVSSALQHTRLKDRISAGATGETPADVAAREIPRLISERFRVVRTRVAPRPVELDLTQLRAGEDVEALVLVAIMGMNDAAVRSLGEANVDLWIRLIDREGKVIWESRRREATFVSTYRAQNDWRVHLRAALRQGLDQLR